MTIQTLVVTIDQTDYSLLEKMNIQTDAIVGNQCQKNEIEQFEYNGHKIQWLSFDSRGVGINRNEILMRAKADICVLADDDMSFKNNYEDIVCQWFKEIPDADILIFNLDPEDSRFYKNTRVNRVNRLNYGKYGAARFVLRTRSVLFSGVTFHTLFGGGCQYSCGEDTIFLRECLRKGLKVFCVPESIASIEEGDSTWFQGYTDKYFFDRGVQYYVLDRRLCQIHALYHCLKYRKKYRKYGWRKAFRQMLKGINSVR